MKILQFLPVVLCATAITSTNTFAHDANNNTEDIRIHNRNQLQASRQWKEQMEDLSNTISDFIGTKRKYIQKHPDCVQSQENNGTISCGQ